MLYLKEIHSGDKLIYKGGNSKFKHKCLEESEIINVKYCEENGPYINCKFGFHYLNEVAGDNGSLKGFSKVQDNVDA